MAEQLEDGRYVAAILKPDVEASAKPSDPEAVLRAKHLPQLIKSIVTAVGTYGNDRLAAAIAPLVARIEALEAATPEYCGVHTVGRAYRRNQLVTHTGSMWICLRPTSTTPPGDAWQLCVKAGRPGRDGRDRFEPPPQPPRLQ